MIYYIHRTIPQEWKVRFMNRIHLFMRHHKTAFIAIFTLLLFISISVYQSIYADDDGIPTAKVYWMTDTPLPIDKLSTWILPHNGGYLIITDNGTLACELNAGLSLSFFYPSDDPQTIFHACFSEDNRYQILSSKPSGQVFKYSLRTVSADGEIIAETILTESAAAYVDCRMEQNTLALITETQFLVFSVSDTAQQLYEQAYTGTSPQVCITDDTVLFSASIDNQSLLVEYSIADRTVNTAAISYAPLFALSAAPSGTDSKYLIGCGKDLFGMDAQFSVKERFLDLRETWQKSKADSTFKQTLTQDNISAVFTDGTALYITDNQGCVYKLDVFWGDLMQTS